MDAINHITKGRPKFGNVMAMVSSIGPSNQQFQTLERTRHANFNLELLGAIFQYQGTKKHWVQKVVMFRMCHFNYKPIINQGL